MKLISAEVNWYIGWSNEPILVLNVDELPEQEEFTFDSRIVGPDTTLYFAVHPDGAVRFYSHHTRDQTGFCGGVFRLNMKDGTRKEIKGPWSSRAGVMNRYFEPECVDVTAVDAKGYRWGTAVTLELAQEAARMAGVTLVRRKDHGDIVYRIAEPKPKKKEA